MCHGTDVFWIESYSHIIRIIQHLSCVVYNNGYSLIVYGLTFYSPRKINKQHTNYNIKIYSLLNSKKNLRLMIKNHDSR